MMTDEQKREQLIDKLTEICRENFWIE